MDSSRNSTQAMWVGVGQFLSYAIGILSPMVLSRYFDKCDYGTYKQVMYVYNTLLTVFAFGLPRAYSYFIPRVSLGESKDIIRKLSKLFTVLGTAFSLLLFFGSSTIATLLNNDDLDVALKVFAPTPLFLLPVMGLDCILASYKSSKLMAYYSVSTKILTLLLVILPVILFKGSYIYAIVGFDIASLISFVIALYLRNIPTKGISLEKTSVTFKAIFSFTVPLIMASFWMMIFQSANQFFISRYYGNETFAEFSNGFIDFPIIPMVLSSVATVLLPVFSGYAANDSEKIKCVWINALLKSVKITYPMIVFCFFFASVVMTCFYGSAYAESSSYFMVKSVEGLFMVIPFYPILLALGKSREYSNIHLVMALVIVVVEFIIVRRGLPAIFIGVAYVACSISKIFMQFIVVGKSIKIKAAEFVPIRSMLRILLVSALSAVPSMALYHVLSNLNHFVLLSIILCIYLISYYMFCWVFKITYKDIAESFLDKKMRHLLRFIP